eukprot:scaffold7195_cov417-Prasinococcus_capsulatus_cf.AAC.6
MLARLAHLQDSPLNSLSQRGFRGWVDGSRSDCPLAGPLGEQHASPACLLPRQQAGTLASDPFLPLREHAEALVGDYTAPAICASTRGV